MQSFSLRQCTSTGNRAEGAFASLVKKWQPNPNPGILMKIRRSTFKARDRRLQIANHFIGCWIRITEVNLFDLAALALDADTSCLGTIWQYSWPAHKTTLQESSGLRAVTPRLVNSNK